MQLQMTHCLAVAVNMQLGLQLSDDGSFAWKRAAKKEALPWNLPSTAPHETCRFHGPPTGGFSNLSYYLHSFRLEHIVLERDQPSKCFVRHGLTKCLLLLVLA